MNSPSPWKTMITVAAFSIIGSQNAFGFQSYWTAQDANGQWSLPVPTRTWIGGSYYQIMERVNEADKRGEGDETHAQIFRGLSQEARYLDAVLFRLEMSADGTHSDGSFIRIKTTATRSGYPPVSELTSEVWTKLGSRFLGSTAGVVDVKLLNHQEDLAINGYQVAAVNYKAITEGGRGDRYQGLVIIYRPSSITSFNISTPWHVMKPRWEEMWKMLKSIEFTE